MSDIATASLVMSTMIVLMAGLLGWREWTERHDRAFELSVEDARHFGHQDRRRLMGIIVLILLAVGLVVGSRISPRIGNATNPQFLAVWLGIFLLIFFLLALAMIDFLALRLFARRHRNEILRERIQILQEERRLRNAQSDNANANGQGNGHGEEPLRDLFT